MTDPTVPQPATPYPTAGAPVPAPPGTDYPGKTLGIVGLVLAFIFAIAGLIVSIIARSQSKAAGYKNGIATAGIIVSVIVIVLYIIGTIVGITIFAALASQVAEMCGEGGGSIVVDGTTYPCS